MNATLLFYNYRKQIMVMMWRTEKQISHTHVFDKKDEIHSSFSGLVGVGAVIIDPQSLYNLRCSEVQKPP